MESADISDCMSSKCERQLMVEAVIMFVTYSPVARSKKQEARSKKQDSK